MSYSKIEREYNDRPKSNNKSFWLLVVVLIGVTIGCLYEFGAPAICSNEDGQLFLPTITVDRVFVSSDTLTVTDDLGKNNWEETEKETPKILLEKIMRTDNGTVIKVREYSDETTDTIVLPHTLDTNTLPRALANAEW